MKNRNKTNATLPKPSVPQNSENEKALAMALKTNKTRNSALDEIKRLTNAIQAGNLTARGNIDGLNGEWAEALNCFNKALDSYVAPWSAMTDYAQSMARGKVPAKSLSSFDGDFGSIAKDLNAGVDQLQLLIAELNHMSAEHDRGDIDVAIDTSKFQNDFAKVATGINGMVNGHIAVKKKAIACIAEFGKGNFEVPLEKFPGKKAFINDTIEQMRTNLIALMAELNHMSAEHDRGDIDVVIAAEKFENDFAKVATGINGMVNGHIAVKKKAMACIAEFGRGNFEAPMEKLPGKKAFINDTIEQVRANLKALVADANMLAIAAVEGRLQTRADASKHQGDYRRIVEGVNNTLDSVIGPLNVAATYVDQISKGAVPAKITDAYNGDFNVIKNNLNTCIDAVNALVADANMLAIAAVEGRLQTRADASKHQGDYRRIVEGVNNTLDSVIGPLNVAATYVDQISKGAVPAKITDAYNGDFNVIKNNLNTCIDAVNALVADANMLAIAAVEGRLQTRADASKHQGDYRRIVEGVNNTLDSVIGPLNVAATYVDQISKGAVPAKITDAYNGDFNVIKNNLNTCIDAVNALVADANMLAIAAVEGRLQTRADASKHQGDYRRIVEGVNNTLDSVIGPLNVAATYVDQISKGAVPAKITDAYNGDFNVIKNNLNTCIDAVNALVADANMLAIAAVEGRLQTRADASKHQGDYRRIVEGVNNTLDSVIGPLNVAATYVDQIAKGAVPAKITDAYNGDFNVIKNNLNTCIDAVNALVADANMLAIAAVEGRLQTRADASKHQGDYRRIVEGVNNTLDSVIGPLNVAATYVDQISKGAVPAKITDAYNGDFNVIKNNLNTCIDAVNALVADANMLAIAAVEGRLQTRADASKHQGDYRRIVEGVNNTLDSVIGPLNVAATYVDQISKGAVPAKITDAYNGDFNVIKNNLNTCIDAVNALVADANMLAIAAVEGRLQTRADASKHQGDYRRIVEGVNNTLDSVIGPVNNIARAIEALGRNDMSVQLEGEYRGDFLAVKTSFDDALTGINNTLFQIVDAVEQVGQSADQLSAASQNMASTSEEQASAVEEVTSSLTQTDSQVKANTENANAANQLVIGTSQAATQGQTKMEAMTEAMTAINAASQNIGKIIKVIDEIAFQTNLLALNAAVEAARAGQHGRGFAVVAQEVRNLAGRSAKAARETSDMIEDSVKRVSEGVSIAKETREALNVIVTNVVKVKDLVAEIATASTEQSRGVSQINQAMGQVGKSAQAGSQQSEELASSSGELANIAARMRDEVRRFKLRERKASGSSANVTGLEGLTSEMVAQLKAMLSAKAQAAAPAKSATTDSRKSGKAMLPLDQDERGYGNF